METPESFCQCKIGKGFPIIANDALPGGEPNVSFFILQHIAGDAAGSIGRYCIFWRYKIRIIPGNVSFWLPVRGCFGFTHPVAGSE